MINHANIRNLNNKGMTVSGATIICCDLKNIKEGIDAFGFYYRNQKIILVECSDNYLLIEKAIAKLDRTNRIIMV